MIDYQLFIFTVELRLNSSSTVQVFEIQLFIRLFPLRLNSEIQKTPPTAKMHLILT